MSFSAVGLLLHFLVILPHFTPSLGSVMGKLNHDTQILHFTHPHPLELNPNDHTTQPSNMNAGNLNPIMSTYMLCASCQLPENNSNDLIYLCNPCNFHLHLSSHIRATVWSKDLAKKNKNYLTMFLPLYNFL